MSDYFCTVGFGLDHFAAQELSFIPSVIVQQKLVGKVFFKATGNLPALLSLRTIERLFVKVIHVQVDPNIASLEEWLKSKLSSISNTFPENLINWREITKNHTSPVKFRINSRLSGSFRKASHFQEVSSLAANILKQECSFVKDLYQPDVEVFLHLNDNFFTVGLPVTKKPLSDRSYLKHIAVRSTVCCAMCMAVDLKPEDIVLDPMCGAGTILVEATKQFNCRAVVGVDCSLSQLKLAQSNLDSSSTLHNISLICGDSRAVILRQGTFDVVLCDVPFGRKFGQAENIQQLLSRVVTTIDLLLKPGGRVCILISEKLRLLLIDLCPNWSLLNQYPLRLGTLTAAIVIWKK